MVSESELMNMASRSPTNHERQCPAVQGRDQVEAWEAPAGFASTSAGWGGRAAGEGAAAAGDGEAAAGDVGVQVEIAGAFVQPIPALTAIGRLFPIRVSSHSRKPTVASTAQHRSSPNCHARCNVRVLLGHFATAWLQAMRWPTSPSPKRPKRDHKKVFEGTRARARPANDEA